MPYSSGGLEAPRPLRGHSGAVLTLHRKGGRNMVRKMAGRPEQNDRLRQQCEKQDAFRHEWILTPRVFGCGYVDGLYYFDMDYVPGISLAALITQEMDIPFGLLSGFCEKWLEYAGGPTSVTVPPQAFTDNLAAIAERCQANGVVAELINDIHAIVACMSRLSWPSAPRTICHGDLTLENILIGKDGRFYLIDFDTPNILSAWMDFGKLYQDLLGYWCIRSIAMTAPRSLRLNNAIQALFRLRAEVDRVLTDRMPDMAQILPQLAAFNLLRALPYCRDDDIAHYLIQRIRAVLEGIPTLEPPH